MNTEQRFSLIKSVGEEIITQEDLKILLDSKKHPIAYDGFEPSNVIHIAQGILRAININRMTSAGCKFKMLVADWHGWANNKMGGDLEKIQNVGKYLIECWKATGMDLDNIEFVWASDFMDDDEYWKIVMQMARNSTLQRVLRCTQIMGRKESDILQASQIMYPCMQAADVFYLGVDICQLGMDQRKVNVLARELGEKLAYGNPVAVHHHMLMGLGQPPATETTGIERHIELKMSKSKPDSAIFMTDSEAEIIRKIGKAYCPVKEVVENPILEYCKYLVFGMHNMMTIERPARFGGNLEFTSYTDLEHHYREGLVHPMDLKNAVAHYIDAMVRPVREHFENNAKARKLLEEIKGYEVTR
ncbi:tyrosine--tRNA ligase [Candidatus Woesearchaeota archaeon]|nr:tyrosine--tRNA ligase [Candidatus Woesearchaeota archaeon]